MQNPNQANVGHLSNRSQASLLDARSLSPSVHMMHNFHDVYPAEVPAQQYYHSMPHSQKSISNVHDRIPANNRTMSSIINRSFAPAMNSQMQASNEFAEQYNRLQQARMQQQMKTHSEAVMRKQQTFAMRQMMHPPPMSRQVSAVNIHQQVNISTQTTPNTQLPQAIKGAATQGNPFGLDHFHSHLNTQRNSLKHFDHIEKPSHLQLQQEHQKLIQSLRNDFELKAQHQKLERQSTNPFMQSSDVDSDARLDSGVESPVHQSLAYREFSSSSATSTPTKLLKSPKTRRQPTSLVTFSGWLYKQGSEGLRTWRRRWFVLSDYCLFYYKGPEEDKLLGSILLPSYILSECTSSDHKAYKKFSFKLEHKNMRTYYLASENADYMRKWMRVIRAATLMQNTTEIQTRKMLATSIPISTNYDPGYNQYRTEQSQSKPDIHPTLNPFLIFDEDNERQPLYVNAPPKPRRSHNEMEFAIFGNDTTMFPLSSEASADSTPKGIPLRMLEYEDIYNEHGRQSRGDSMRYAEEAKHKHGNVQKYGVENVAAAYNSDFSGSMGKKSYQQKKMPPRPRSADFLEYESKRQMRRSKDFDTHAGRYKGRLPSRPKSSLDINSAMDNYYYSEASYAAKMRQSAQYLQNRNLMPKRDDTRLNTLRYENDRKRLTNEFNNYTANLILNNGLTLPRSKYMSSNEPFQFSSLMRSSEESAFNSDSRYTLKNSESTLTDQYRSNDMISGKTSSMSIRDDLQNSNVNTWTPNISAGTLLSKTHEELVLLLIQLRRQTDIKERGMDRRLKDMQSIQRRLKDESDATGTRLELMGRMEVLREEVNKMEQQYEKTKPLVNLVDNMVKLGSLYRAGSMQWDSNSMSSGMTLQRLRVNQKELERQLQLDDQKQWNKFDPTQIELNNKVQQLYELDQRLQEESNNLQILQQDKEEIESALEELNHRFATNMLPENYMTSKKIQHSLELELSKVHSQLAENSRRLEETVASNTKLERELLVLRQKLQASRDKSSGQLSYMSVMANSRTADAFETELRKVRESVGDTKRQREELSMAVNQLTLDSNATHDRVRTSSNDHLNSGKRLDSDWRETDLDSTQKKNARNMNGNLTAAAMFEQTYRNENEPYYYQYQQTADDLGMEGQWQGNDKQEIKTVRIVKRESERRHRDKDKLNQNYDSTAMANEFTNPNEINDYLPTYQSEPKPSSFYDDEPSASKAKSTIRNAAHSMANTNPTVRSDNIFQSHTAREILSEHGHAKEPTKSSAQPNATANNNQRNQYKRFTPRKKKRHNTAPSENFMDYMAERDAYKYNNHRARDDLDMEVVLRSNPPIENAISGPPDVIRSALGHNNEYLFDKSN